MCRRANAVGPGKMLYLSPDNRIGRICPGYNRLEGWFFERRQWHKLTGRSPNSHAKAERANISRGPMSGCGKTRQPTCRLASYAAAGYTIGAVPTCSRYRAWRSV
jgi:hypothetical protein